VYQTVHDLEAMGEVELLDVGTGSIRVDPNVEHAHQHLVCTRCGTVRDVLLDIADLRVPSRYRREFKVEAVEVVFRGVCDDCLAREPVDA
jgi:Fe2+ or Zn2+ uptake regulation protein